MGCQGERQRTVSGHGVGCAAATGRLPGGRGVCRRRTHRGTLATPGQDVTLSRLRVVLVGDVASRLARRRR